jgi:ribonuclease HII
MKSEKLKFKIQNYPNFHEEQKLWRNGFRVVVGLDEAGRGPLAGPVCAAAVCVGAGRAFSLSASRTEPSASLRRPSLKSPTRFFEIRDSKKLTPKQREKWYKILIRHPDIKWGVGIVSEKIVDKINIFEATKLAMIKAIESLSRKSQIVNRGIDFLILDGNFTLEKLSINQKAIIRGDEKIFSCAAASIIAKVTRDRLMRRLAKKYPEYGFERHKGYGTQFHREAIKKHGPCKIHRQSFRPISLT